MKDRRDAEGEAIRDWIDAGMKLGVVREISLT
jgi:hypothetical protein